MKLNTNSNIYTFIYMTVVVVIVAVLLAFVNQTLKQRQDDNKQLDIQKQILGALKVDYADQDPAKVYEGIIAIGDTLQFGEKQVFVAHLNDTTVKYVLPLAGKGLWGGIGGYLALDEDKNTIYGVNFNHESETPGLGAKIVEYEFRQQFEGKQICKENVVVSVAVLKKGKTCEAGEDYQVDAISGATITSEGVSKMLNEELCNNYAEFLGDVPAVEENVVESNEEKEVEDVVAED